MKRNILIFFLVFCCIISFSQEKEYVKGIIDTLSSPDFYGRGYVKNGDKIAADYIRQQLKKNYIIPFTVNYFQSFAYPINSFPGIVSLKIGDNFLKPGLDFFVDAASPKIKGKFKTIWLDENSFSTSKKLLDFNKTNLSKKILILDTGFKEIKNPKLFTAKGIIYLKKKDFYWSVSGADDTTKYIAIDLKRTSISGRSKNAEIIIENKYFKKYRTQNVAGYIRGSVSPDTFIVFTAHYDHLGEMGSGTYFPGANDNASGVALLLDLSKHFSKLENKPYYSIAFLFFSGEEAGLYGSNYFSQRPLFPLENIKMLINFDMVGTGSDGIKVINGTIFKTEFDKLAELNKKGGYLKTVAVRGEAANSDHYYFYKKGVKAIYIHTLGNEHREYHTLGDKSSVLPLTKYESLFRLTVDFINSFSQKKQN
jgi:hypothetical protein